MSDLSRRELLIGAATIGGAWAISDGPGSGGAVPASTGPRDQALRPVLGGTWISPASIDKFGTLGIGVEDGGDPAIVTNRHVVDDGSGESPSEVIGRDVTQPDQEGGVIGTVADASEIGGAGSSDWAVVGVEAAADWSTHTLGFGQVGAPVSPSAGERIVLDGAATGLLGATVTRTSVSANFRGELYSGMIEYQVDADRDTSGDSGGLVASIDSNGVVHPVGLHTFAVDAYRFAIPWSDLPSSVSVSTAGESPVAPAVGEYVEAAVYEQSGSDWWVWARNLGDVSSSVSVEIADPASGDVLDSQQVTIGSLSDVALRLSSDQDSVVLSVGKTEIEVSV